MNSSRQGFVTAVRTVVLLLTGTACTHSSAGRSPQALLLQGAPAGYKVEGGLNGSPLSLQDASQATVVDMVTARSELSALGFAGGAVRVWTAGTAYVSAIDLRFHTNRAAAELVSFEVSQAQTFVGTFTFPVQGVDGGKGYALSGASHSGATSLYCYVVWFARGSDAFGISDCAPHPNSVNNVVSLARRQLSRLGS